MKKALCILLCLTLSVPILPMNTSGSEIIGGEDSGLVNILLIGQDNREAQETSRSDCIILCSIRPEAKAVTMVSFLRDLYVPIPGHGSNRLNAAWAIGGMELLKQTLSENFGLHIDGCIGVDFSNFPGIIDTLGGVSLELRQDEADAINNSIPGNLKSGVCQLTGDQALAYSRIRKLDADGDFSRTQRQRKLLTSLLEQYREASLLTILSTLLDTLPMLSTDMETKQLLVLAAKLFPVLEEPAVTSLRIPADGSYSYRTVRGMEILWTDLEDSRLLLRDTLVSVNENVC